MSSKDLVNSLNAKADFENFSEEVEILSVTKTGNMALYSAKNKNGITFQNVPGLAGLKSRGYLGYVNGDRSRPIMISGLSSSSVTVSDIGDSGLDGIPNADITPTAGWDIQLTAVSILGNSTITRTFYIVV